MNKSETLHDKQAVPKQTAERKKEQKYSTPRSEK